MRVGPPVRAGVSLAVLAAVAGCTERSELPPDPYDIDQTPELELIEELRLGSVDDPDQGFSRIGGVDVDRDGNVYVFEEQDLEIRVFDRDGTPLRTIGRRGEGPGEFEGFNLIGVRGDTLWAVQIIPDRLTLFTRGGEVISAHRAESLRIPAPGCAGYVSPGVMLPDGTFSSWMSSVRCGSNDEESGLEHGDSIPVPRVRFAATGQVLDTVGWDPIPPPGVRTPPEIPEREFPPVLTIAGSRYRVPSAPSPRTLSWEPLPDGRIATDISLATASGRSTFLVARLDLAGDTVYRTDLAYTPVPYSEKEIEAMARRIAEAGGDEGRVSQATDAILAEMDYPPFRSPVARSRTMTDGALWLMRDRPGDEREWVIVDADGQLRGKVTLSERSSPEWSDGEAVWVSEPDRFEVPWLVRYRIEG